MRATKLSRRGFTVPKKQDITAEIAREHFAYDPETGVITWRVSPRYGMEAGVTAGAPIKRGYITVTFCGHHITAHRLAWLLHYGCWPTHGIDHINRIKTDNRICNLRDVPQAENVRNREPSCLARPRARIERVKSGRFRAVVSAERKKHYFGTFDSPVAAYVAAQAALSAF